MRKIFIYYFAFIFLLLPMAYPGVIKLKSGEELSGTIVEKTIHKITIKVEGELFTFTPDEVASIRGRKPKTVILVDSQEETLTFNNALRVASQGNVLHAEDMFKELLQEDPLDINSREALRAINDFRNGVINRDYTVYLFKGAYYFFIKDYQKTIEVYQKALLLNPEATEVYYNLASAYQILGQNQKAVEYFKKLVKANPQDLDVLFNLGAIYHSLEEYEKALLYFEKLLEIFPDDSETHAFLGTSYYALGQFKKAKTSLNKAKALFEGEGRDQQARDIVSLLDNLPQ